MLDAAGSLYEFYRWSVVLSDPRHVSNTDTSVGGPDVGSNAFFIILASSQESNQEKNINSGHLQTFITSRRL